MNGMFYKIGGIGALILLVGMILGATGLLSPQNMGLLSGIGAIIGGIGVVVLTLGFYAIWKSNGNLLSMLTMVFGFIGGILLLVEGILAVASVGALIYVGASNMFVMATFFILGGLVFYELEKAAAKAPFLHATGTLSLATAVALFSGLGGAATTLIFLPIAFFYMFVFFKM